MNYRSDFHIRLLLATFPAVTPVFSASGRRQSTSRAGGRRVFPARRLLIVAVVGILVTLALMFSNQLRTVEGLVVAVDGDLRMVRSFEVLSGGNRLRFFPDPAGRFGFPLPHLSSHMRSFDPVVVTYRTAPDGALVAVEVDDA